MKKTILNLGRQLSKKEQINIFGGSGDDPISHECDPSIQGECCVYLWGYYDCDTGSEITGSTTNICQGKYKECQPYPN